MNIVSRRSPQQRTVIYLMLLLLVLSAQNLAQPASREPVRAPHAMVASTSEIASRVGAEVMRKGGNAIDAAVAVGLALAVVWPTAGNLGGGGFLLVSLADGTTEAIDFRERAPVAATKNMYLDESGNVIPGASTKTYKASGVPGTVAGLEMALARHGKLDWAELIEPALQLAEDGFVLNHATTQSLRANAEALSRFPESKRIFLRDGNYYREGEIFRQPDLAATLQRLRQNGPREFYEGKTADLIVADMKASGGLITKEDLFQYQPVIRKPLEGSYRGYRIITMPPPSSGGIALIAMLNMLELRDLKSIPYHSADHLHVMVEIMRRAFADRSKYLGDPDFVKVPVERLVSKEYAKKIASTISMDRATPSASIEPGAMLASAESYSTTHYAIADAHGNVVSCTYTLNDSFGSGATARGTGILLNNEMDDFTSAPNVPNLYGLIQGESNTIAPKKRPLSSMTPTIMLRNNKPYIAVGSKGGPSIINSVLQTIVNVIDYGMQLQQAIDSPRIHHQWLADKIFFEPFGINPDVKSLLIKRGHIFSEKPYFTETPYIGDTHAVMIDSDSGMRLGASDSRLAGVPVGY